MSQTVEEIALKGFNKVQIATLKYCVQLIKKYPADMVIDSLEDYIKELENE